MVARNVLIAALCTGFLALNGNAMADQYQPSEFLGLDLSKAVLSPKRLGPDAEFAPVPIEAKADHGSDTQRRAVSAEPKVVARRVRTLRVVEKPRAPARARLTRRHTNPLDAHAADTRVQARIQAWPCKSGGICNWQR